MMQIRHQCLIAIWQDQILYNDDVSALELAFIVGVRMSSSIMVEQFSDKLPSLIIHGRKSSDLI